MLKMTSYARYGKKLQINSTSAQIMSPNGSTIGATRYLLTRKIRRSRVHKELFLSSKRFWSGAHFLSSNKIPPLVRRAVRSVRI